MVCDLEPGNPTAIYLLGLLAIENDDFKDAIKKISQAIQIDYRQPKYHMSLANVYIKIKNFPLAVKSLTALQHLKPKYPYSNYKLGNCYFYQKDYKTALKYYMLEHRVNNSVIVKNKIASCYIVLNNLNKAIYYLKSALELNPTYAEAIANLSECERRQGHYSLAKELAEKALTFNPTLLTAWNNLGCALMELGCNKEAETAFLHGIQYFPDSYKLCENLSELYNNVQSTDKAINVLQQAVSLNPSNVSALQRLAELYFSKGDINKSISTYKKIILYSPEDQIANTNIAYMYSEQNNSTQANNWLKKSNKNNINNPDTLYNLASICISQNKLEEAQKHLVLACKKAPNSARIHAKYYYLTRILCDWKTSKLLNNKLDILLKNTASSTVEPGENPFINLLRTENPYKNHKAARDWSSYIEKSYNDNIRNIFIPRNNTEKIKIGYLNTNIQKHSTTDIIQTLDCHHNFDEFEIYFYSNSEYNNKLILDNCNFKSINKLSIKQCANRIYADQLDILVDLNGPTISNRIEICALKPVPIQINYLGFPGTTGAAFFNYCIGDSTVTPFREKEFYTEKLLHMPHTFMLKEYNKVSKIKYTRKQCGLPEEAFIYCCLTQNYKINLSSMKIWLNILKATPGSILWLLDCNAVAKKNILDIAVKHRVNPKRIVFAPKLPKEDHLARVRLANLALDTLTYNARTATSDAIYAGVPVITTYGCNYASRVSSSILKAVNSKELVCINLETYQTLAIELFENQNYLKVLRKKLRASKNNSYLFNPIKTITDLEAIYSSLLTNNSN